MFQRHFQKPLLGVLLIGAASLIAYWPALSGQFLWDDEALVVNNRLVHDPDGLYRIWCTTDAIDYWPVTNTAFWLEWRLWGTDTVGYHAVNLALHVVNSLLIWLILRRFSMPGAFLAALLFAVHPVNVESVAWIAQLKNVLAMFFFLLSAWCYLRADSRHHSPHKTATAGRGEAPIDVDNLLAGSRDHRSRLYDLNRWYWLGVLAFALAMLSKGAVAVLPPVLLLIVWWQHRQITKRDLLGTLPFWLVAATLTAVNIWFQTHGSHEIIRSASFAERLGGAGVAIWFYLSKALAPLGLSFVYPLRHIEPTNALCWLPLCAAIAVTVALWWKRRTSWDRAAFFAWSFFGVALLPVLGFADVYFMRYSLVADHYQYIALIAVTALVASALSLPPAARRPPPAWLTAGSCLIVLAALTALSRRQCEMYADPITLWQTTLDKNPDCPLAHTNLGRELQKRGQLAEAIEHFQAAIQIDPQFAEAHCGLASALAGTGKREEAINECQLALKYQPSNVQAHNDLAGLLLGEGQLAAAIEHCEQALKFNRDYAEAHTNLGIALSASGQLDEAITHIRRSIRLAPQNAETYNSLANALVKSHRPQEAIAQYQQALRLKPNYLQACSNLALAYAQASQPLAALTAAEQALALADSTGQTQQAEKLRSWIATYRAAQIKRIDTAVKPAAAGLR
jgi:protein O-mannosyl-transferase